MTYYTTSVNGINFSLPAATLDEIFNHKVDPTNVFYEFMNDYANACLDNYS